MTSKFSIFYLLFFGILVSCSKKEYSCITVQNNPITSKKLNEIELKNWSYMDILEDSIPGISLNKAYNTILKNKEGKQVIVAVIDQVVDIEHRDLKGGLWVNVDEVKNNNKDDDKNGYIDDINGWDFLGNIDGIDNKFSHYDYTRFIKKHYDAFEKKESRDLPIVDSINYKRYQKAKLILKRKTRSVPEDIEYANNISTYKAEAKLFLSKYFKNGYYSIKALDSLKNIYPKDSLLQDNVLVLKGFISQGFTDKYLETLILNSNNLLKKQLNINYNEREFLGDDPDNLKDYGYGYWKVNNNVEAYTHGTIVSGVVLKNSPQIKIMPLCILGHGSSHDKDIALAIQYAVDNGAKVINMSFGKDFSIYKHWVDYAIKYAEEHNVLIVTSAGNDYHNMDNPNKFNFPDDRDVNGNEFTSNFLKVGGSTNMPNENLKYDSSNYGRINVDIFAPSEKIYTTFPNNEYKYDTGTSLASAITSKVAALLFSYYPNLTAAQVKQIIMDSGVEYTFPVKTPTRKDKNKMTPFNELSKSGKIVNAYNALIMADSISRKGSFSTIFKSIHTLTKPY